jgi:hypothetical protein
MFEACIDFRVEDGFDTMELTMVRARHSCICGECGGEIKPGEFFQFCYGTYANRKEPPFTFRTCWVCLAILRDFGINQDRLFGALWDAMREVYGIASPSDVPDWDEDLEQYWLEENRRKAGLPVDIVVCPENVVVDLSNRSEDGNV